jgi:vacuolar-type H+-ATPase subunit H
MVKEILEDIIAAEKRAEEIERDALSRARETGIEAMNKADALREASEKSLKAEVKEIMLAARRDAESKAALKLKNLSKAAARDTAEDPKCVRAAKYIEKMLYGTLEKRK